MLGLFSIIMAWLSDSKSLTLILIMTGFCFGISLKWVKMFFYMMVMTITHHVCHNEGTSGYEYLAVLVLTLQT